MGKENKIHTAHKEKLQKLTDSAKVEEEKLRRKRHADETTHEFLEGVENGFAIRGSKELLEEY